MDHEQLPLSQELLGVMRGAVTYAVANGNDYVSPSHFLMALLDDASLRDMLGEHLERGTLIADTRKKKLPGVLEVPEVPLPEGEVVPFKRYDTLAFRSTDGKRVMWLDRDAYKIFIEGARRVEAGAFKPRHLALGYVTVSKKDVELVRLLGPKPQDVTQAILDIN
jgi:hypothetical protein